MNNSNKSLKTLKTWSRTSHEGGWRTDCQNSPLPKGEPSCVAEGEGWEPVTELRPRDGYEYALVRGCTSKGFQGRADKQYWRRVRRPL